MSHRTNYMIVVMGVWLVWSACLGSQQASAANILIHMETSLALDDAQICAVPNVAWAAVKAGHKVRILVDASAVTSVVKGFEWFRTLVGSDATALDRAGLPERERRSLSVQIGVPIEQVRHNYGEYVDLLKNKLGVAIYGNQTMMLRYKIDPDRVAASVTPIPLANMVDLFTSADRILVY